MSHAPTLRFVALLACLVPTALAAQVPAELREAMHARDQAIAKIDAPTWDRLTADDFTVVQEDGVMMTKAERLAQFKTQKPSAETPKEDEQIKHYGDVFVRRFRSGAVWVLDVWVKDVEGWRVAAVQVTTAKK